MNDLTRHNLEQASANNAADSSTSSNTSDKDSSGGDEEGGSNTSSNSNKMNTVNLNNSSSLSIGTFGPMSSLSGSEPDGNNSGGGTLSSGSSSRAGILRSCGNNNNTSFSSSSEGASSSSENNAGDELSERVVVRGKSVTSQQLQPQCKVSFAVSNIQSGEKKKKRKHPSPKRRRSPSQDKNEKMPQSGKSEEKCSKRQRNATSTISTAAVKPSASAQEPKNNSISFSDYNASASGVSTLQQLALQLQQQMYGNNPSVAAVSYASSTTSQRQTLEQESYSQASSFSTAANQPTVQNPINGSPVCTSTKLTEPTSPPSSPNKLSSNPEATTEERRLERNQREKERSNRIASQVDTLRCLLQRGGLFIPKNTKSTVLNEASNYIRTLQERQQLMSMEMEGLKRQLVVAVALKNGGEAGGAAQQATSQEATADSAEQDYHLIFKNTMAGMAVASMGGALLDW
jgi:hypothetical protein